MPMAKLRANPLEVSLRLPPIPSGMPMSAKAKQANENDCLEVTAFANLALSFLDISGSDAR